MEVDELDRRALRRRDVIEQHFVVDRSDTGVDGDVQSGNLRPVDAHEHRVDVVFPDEAHHPPDGGLEQALVERPDDVGDDRVAFLGEDADPGGRLVEVFGVVEPLVVFGDPADLLHFAVEPVDVEDAWVEAGDGQLLDFVEIGY